MNGSSQSAVMPPVYIALVILEDTQGRVYLQLRSQAEGVAHPGKWGLFGGHLEPGESFVEAALREIGEELSCRLQPDKMVFLTDFNRQDGPVLYYQLFHYLVTNEFDRAELTEGEDYGAFPTEVILSGELDGVELVHHHLERLRDYWANHRGLPA